MAKGWRTNVVTGATLGITVALLLFGMEVLGRGPRSPWSALLVLSLAVAVGGAGGALVARVDSWSVLVALLFLAPMALGSMEVHWAVGRAFDLILRARLQSTVHAIEAGVWLALGAGALVMGAGVIRVLPARAQRPTIKAVAIALSLSVIVPARLILMDIDALHLGVALVVIIAALFASALFWDRTATVASAFGFAASVAAVAVVPGRYPALCLALAAVALGLGVLLTRRLAKHRRLPGGQRAAAGMVFAIVASLVVSEHLVTAVPSVWRARPGGGRAQWRALRVA